MSVFPGERVPGVPKQPAPIDVQRAMGMVWLRQKRGGKMVEICLSPGQAAHLQPLLERALNDKP